MKKNDKMSVSDWERLYKRYEEKDSFTVTFNCDDEEISCRVKHRLSPKEVMNLVASVYGGVIDIENDVYYPELKDYFLRIAVLEAYTNITLPQGLDKCWKLVYGTPVFAMITGSESEPVAFSKMEFDNAEIDTEQYKNIVAAIDEKIAFGVSQITRASGLDNIIRTFLPAIEGFLSQIDGKDLKEFMGKVNGMGKLDTEKLVNTVFEHRTDDTKSKVVEFKPKDTADTEGR